MTRWFRFYDDVINDPKVMRLSEEMRWHWVAVLCCTSKNDGRVPSTKDLAFMLRLKEQQTAAIVTQLHAGGLLDKVEGGGFVPHNWAGRQYTSNSSAERMRRHRANKKGSHGDASRSDGGDVTVTPQSRTETDSEQNRTDDARDALARRTGNFQQAIVQAFAAANSPNLPETSRAALWLSQGFQEDICLAVITEIVRKKPSITTLNYFDRAITEAHASKAPPRQAVDTKSEDVDWDAVCKTFKTMGHWSRWAGPDPSSPACRAPDEVLEKYGIAKVPPLKVVNG